MSESFLRMPVKASEALKGEIANENGLNMVLDGLYNRLHSDEAAEIHVYQDYILVGVRQKGHGDVFMHKFTNYGFSPNRRDNKSETLAFSIRTIDNGSLPQYCYEAINGNVDALRLTTKHLIRAYEAKVRRMTEKGKDAKLIEEYVMKVEAAKRRLTLPLEDFLTLSEPIMIEIPRNPETFYDEDEVVVSGHDGIDPTDEA